MAYQFLDPETIVETYRTARQYTEGLTDRFPEYERLAANKPHASLPKEYPKTTDGTTASIIRKTPHRIIQQLPTGKVTSVTDDWLSVIAEFIYYSKIIPNANEGYALLQKCWSVIERFLTFGFCPTYTPFINHGGYFCPDLTLPYWGDIFIQPGKQSDADSNYMFMRSWWQVKDIEALIESQQKIKPNQRTWDLEALKSVKEIVSTKDEKAKTPIERTTKASPQGGVELITGFQRGVGAKFYTFHVQTTGQGKNEKHSGTIVRTQENKDPRGELPISFAYGDIDGSNPFGRSIIELVGGLQNLMDGEMQMYQYNRALMLNPPLQKWGNVSANTIKFAPNSIWDMGSSPDNKVEPLQIDTTAIAQFPNNYGLMKSQMLNLLASPDTSISSDVGNPGFSKTPQGVEASRANLSVDDNYVRKQFETWFERWSETAINRYFAEREGVEELQLDDKTIDRLTDLAEDGKFDMNKIQDGKIRIDYSSATPALKFEVDASTSMKEDEAKQLDALQGLTALLSKTTFLEQIVPPEKQIELWNSIVSNSGVEDPQELLINDKDKQQILQKLSQPQDTPPREFINLNYKDAPEDIKRQIEASEGFTPSQTTSPVQQQLDLKAHQQQSQNVLKANEQAHQQGMDMANLPEPPAGRVMSIQDQKMISELKQAGLDDQQIGQALALSHTGYSMNQIIQILQQGMNQQVVQQGGQQ